MKKLLDSYWLRVVQLKCNTSAKSVTPVQIAHRNSAAGLWFAERQKEIFLSHWYYVKWWRKFCAETLQKCFLE